MAQGIKLSRKFISNGIEYEYSTKHPIYNLRYTIMTRCYNAKSSDYTYYQGKGVRVCDQWMQEPESFFQWCLDNGWSKGFVLDRINNDQDYKPSNCRFITPSENSKKMHKDNQKVGDNACNVLLTEAKVKEIKSKLAQGITQRRIANDYGVAKSTISMIKSGKNWKQVS